MIERVSFSNSLGQRLVGLLHVGESSQDALGPTVILCHGMMSSKEGRKQVAIAEALEQRGFSILRFDFSFCGESGGRFEEITFSQEVDDLSNAVRWVKGRGGEPVGLCGSSMGGAVALLYARSDPSVKAVVTMAAVGFPARLAGRSAALTERMEEWRQEGFRFGAEGVAGRRFLEDAAVQDVPGAIRELTAPVLILHGAMDEVVPVEEARVLHDHARSPKRLRVFPEADHRFVRSEDLQEALDETLAWFEKFLLPRGE